MGQCPPADDDVSVPVLCHRGHLRPLIGCRASGGGSGGHTELARVIGAVDMPAGGMWIAYIKQDMMASQLVVAVPVTGSLVCISWFNLRNTTETSELAELIHKWPPAVIKHKFKFKFKFTLLAV